MRTFTFKASQTIPREREEVFAFVANPHNLERVMPPWLEFEVSTPDPIEMEVGTTIDYRLRLRGTRMGWRSEITSWDPPRRFVYEQLQGPFRLWIHTHTFHEMSGGTRIDDRLEYAEPSGGLADWFLERPEVRKIFDYRHRAIAELLSGD